jgi:uncharacterized protein (TIRG00374 family)
VATFEAATSSMNGTPPVAADAQQVKRGLGRKIVVAALLSALVFAALAFYSDLGELRQTAETFAPAAFVWGLLLALANYGLRIVRWQYYLKRIGLVVPIVESSVIFLAGFVMSVTPGKLGEVFKSLLLYESRGAPVALTAPVVVAERLTDLTALVLLTAVGALAFEHGVVVAATGAVFVAALLLLCAYRPLGELLLSLTDRLPVVGRFSAKLHEAYASLLQLTRPVPLLLATALAFVSWGTECGSLYLIVHGFSGAHLTWDAATFAYSASTLAGAVAMLPGGLGGTEIAMAALLQALGDNSITPAIATAATILVRIATLWFAVAIGALMLPVYRLMRGTR